MHISQAEKIQQSTSSSHNTQEPICRWNNLKSPRYHSQPRWLYYIRILKTKSFNLWSTPSKVFHQRVQRWTCREASRHTSSGRHHTSRQLTQARSLQSSSAGRMSHPFCRAGCHWTVGWRSKEENRPNTESCIQFGSDESDAGSVFAAPQGYHRWSMRPSRTGSCKSAPTTWTWLGTSRHLSFTSLWSWEILFHWSLF